MKLQDMIQVLPDIDALICMDSFGGVLQQAGSSADQLASLASFIKGIGDLGERLLIDSGCGELSSAVIQGQHGAVVICQVDHEHYLYALANKQAAIGMVVHDLGVCAKRFSMPN